MKATKNIARLAVTAGLTAALSFGGVMAPVTMAFAEGTPTVAESGNVTIKEDVYTDTTFKGIQIFKAKVTQNYDESGWSGDKTLSDIEWASGDVHNAVIKAFDGVQGAPQQTADVQEWVTYINKVSKGKSGKDFKVDADSALNKIAKELEGSNALTNSWEMSANGTFTDLNPGYWLFVTANAGSTKETNKSDGNIDAYTSPIFAIVGGEEVKVAPKKNVPNVTKAVMDDATGSSFGDFANPNKAADSRMDQFIEYQLTGTVASNINTYDEYYYEFEDVLPDSMSAELVDGANKPKVTVKINGDEVTSGYEATYANNVLKVVFTNLKTCTCANGSVSFNADTKVTVDYKAKLDSSKIFENGVMKTQFNGLVGVPQKNKVTLTYSNNPHATDHTTDHGTTVEHPAYDYTYGIDVIKVGSEDGNPALAGVEFTLQEKGDNSNYIKADGTKTTIKDQAKLTTDASGKINVVGLDEGTYVLTEEKPAPGYDNSHSKGITFTITRESLPANDTTVVKPGCTFAPGTDTSLVQSTSADGKVQLTVTDQKGSGLPLTGLNGVTFTWIAGGAVLCIGVAHLIRSRKRDESSEE